MSNEDPAIIPKQGWLKVKLNSQAKWHRRYCIIDWDKAILFIACKADRNYRDYIKLLPNISINEYEPSHDNIIEIKAANETHLVQTESKKEYDCWFLALKQTAYSRVGGAIFGQSLEDTYKYTLDKTSLVPLIVRHCCKFLLEHGSTFVGLFRIPGKQSSIKELRDMYDRGLIVELNDTHSPATVSSLLKIYLQSLPEPIIPIKNFDEFFEIGSSFKYNATKDIDRLKILIEKTLSKTNYALLAYICLFLKKLTEHVHETKMDTDNLALTVGNSLIRTSEILDLNMIKGHNYNLLPLIKAFIDHSDYLFSTNLNESSEQTNESTAKSSGFSSFSSLLSSNEQPARARVRSSSMPSIHCPRFSSMDSANLSYTDPSDSKDAYYHSKSLLEKQTSDKSDQLESQQSFTTCFEKDFSINQEHNVKSFDDESSVQKQFSSIDVGKYEERIRPQSMITEQNHSLDISSQLLSTRNISSSIRKTQKKTFVNKFGKSFSNFKSNMTKAFHPSFSSTEAIQHSNTIDISSPLAVYSYEKSNIFNSDVLTACLKSLQNENRLLKELIDEKETLLINLTKTSNEERLKYENENVQLKQAIKQLQIENSQFKARQQSNS
ncbi:unnamed protein product [Rotaria magnacalcarata]|uniref:Rho GTPase activating protein n=1 Tax=Rotaria magnacalcarata TaxID=392030 RepID=A0A816YLH8_9BILA|nr:unnamed protein product [Rotaria magnacalcarata]CAF2161686.1 unnamed protein product [Rotaria magnacalcarata]CAF3834301.1 unnamed protein product [Rotaria magnacalcarata]CAF3878393.1 unnamed protein product [Rotaria magnacalcarata]